MAWGVILSEDTSNVWVKVLIWCIPVIFGAGGIYTALSHSREAIVTLSTDVKSVKGEVSDHTRQGVGHTATKARLERIEKNQGAIMVRQQSSGENISAICQKIGATCK